MNFRNLKDSLKNEITSYLNQIIGKKCVLLDIPYYSNIGDVLIWQGTESFIKDNGIKCLYRTNCSNFKYRKLSPNVVILMQGGGNFGDIWRIHQDFRLKIIELYPNNPIVILPQTIYYEDSDVMVSDAQIMNKHKNLTICARDKHSKELLDGYFTGSTNLMLPDMAYCISDKVLTKYRVAADDNIALYLKRQDKEFAESNNEDDILRGENRKVETRDWPSMEGSSKCMLIYYYLTKINYKLKGLFACFIDAYMYRIFRKHIVKMGVEFVSHYSAIYTTRLHVAILSTLLEKPFTFVDNSYGKNKQFYDAWLSECEQIKFK